MGLLGFSKKSRKQSKNLEKKKEFQAPTNYEVVIDDSSVSKQPEISFMEDIMNELDSVKSIKNSTQQVNNSGYKRVSQHKLSPPLVSFDQPKTSLNTVAIGLNESGAISPASMTSEHQYTAARTTMQQPQQQRPKPLISLSNNIGTSDSMQRDNTILNSDDTDSYFSDADNEPIIPRSAMRQPLHRHSTQAELLNISVIHGRKAITPPSPSSTTTPTSALNNNIKSSPPASTLATTSTPPTGITLLDRMKERHRLEVRRSLNNSPFLDNQTTATKSSPSMPLIFSAEDSPSSPSTGPLLVQSQSFMTTSTPKRNITTNLIRSTSTVNDIYSGATPIQTHSETSLLQRHSLPVQARAATRSNYLQNGPVYSLPYPESQVMMNHNEDMISSSINRSISAYSSFPQQTLIQQQFKQQQQQLSIQQQIQQQQQQQQIQQKIQQQIEQQQMQQQLEQQQIQYQLDQKQMLLEEQQRIQQYQLQQLKIQQQQQQYLNHAMLEKPIHKRDTNHHHYHHHASSKPMMNESDPDMKPLKTRPLYERTLGSSPPSPNVLFDHHQVEVNDDDDEAPNHIKIPDTPPPESSQQQDANKPAIVMFKPKEKTITLPSKLKRELQGMQLRRSPYSLPDLTTLSSSSDDNNEEQDNIINWNTIQVFNYSPMINNEASTYYAIETTKAPIIDCCPKQEKRHYSCKRQHQCVQSTCNHNSNHNNNIKNSASHYSMMDTTHCPSKHYTKHKHHRCHKRVDTCITKTTQV